MRAVRGPCAEPAVALIRPVRVAGGAAFEVVVVVRACGLSARTLWRPVSWVAFTTTRADA
jgi:hypothetical protein